MAAITAVAFACVLPTNAAAAPSAAGPLQEEKLRQEIRQLQLENRDHTGVRGFLGSYGGLLTGIAALGTVLIALGNLVHQRISIASNDGARASVASTSASPRR